MTSPVYDEKDQRHEIACRARKLVRTFGTIVGANGGRDYFVDNFGITVLGAGHLIVSNTWPLYKIYIQESPRSVGRTVHPEYVNSLLASLRKAMVLEDLADV